MGGKQSNEKTEQQIKDDMKRKWDNFGKIQEAKYEQEQKEKNKQNIESIKEETNNNKIEPENINEEIKEEKKEQEKKTFLTLKPRNEEEQGENKIEEEKNEEKNEINNDEKNENINVSNNENGNDVKENKEDENSIKPVKKNIDYENTTIEKVFHITLDEEKAQKYLFLEFYLAKILSLNQSPSFKLENLDDILLTIMNEQSIKNNLLNYFLDCFHRAYEIIEIRFKDVLGPKFAEIHLAIATYFGQIVSSPESFDIKITKKEISNIIKNYYMKTNEDEFLFLFKDITQNCGEDIDSLSQVLHYLFEIMHSENLNGQTFFKGVSIKKNLSLLVRIFQNYPKVRQVFLNDVLYNPININGRLKQAISFFGPYISYSPLDSPEDQHRNAFKQFTNDSELKSYINKLNNIIDLLTDIVQILDDYDDEKCLNYFYSIVNLNLDWQKTYKNFATISSHGFLLNILHLCLNLFFYECHKNFGDEEDNKNKEYIIKVIKYINTKFCLNDSKIMFSKFNLICSSLCKDYIDANKTKSESIKYNIITKLFFISHSLMFYVLPALSKFYIEANKAASMAFSTQGINNPKTRELIIKMKLFDIYVKNDKFVKNIFEFNEITTFFLISLNNSKFTHNDEYKEENKNNNINSINEDKFSEFKNECFKYMDGTSNIVVSSLPEFLILNMVNSCTFFRQTFSELYFKDFDLIKNLVNFGLVYSSRTDIIHNQHLRSQIFDILLYTFHLEEKDKNNNHLFYIHQKLLKDNFIKENMIFSIMRVFIDAERLGTNNQFYERFNVRNKVLELVNEVFKKNQDILIENIINYSNIHSDEATQMLTLLMSDVTYLIEEVIQRLIDIKNFQELKGNNEVWSKKTEEEKKREEDKFIENDRTLKAECRLLNHSLGFLTIICSCLQKYFIKEEKAERLANLLNYCLDEFTSKSSQLNIKNRNDYSFNPSYILESIIKIYSCFVDYEEFIEFVVRDERCYKYDNFTKAIKIKNELNKVKVDSETSEKFDNLVYNKLKKAEEIVEQNTIDYNDAPEEFLDPLTYVLMEDPVTLPSSHMNIDRKTIEDLLFSNPTDPFNREPLKKEELIPNDELKKKIEEYKQNKLKNKKKISNNETKEKKESNDKKETQENNKSDENIKKTDEENNTEGKKEEVNNSGEK